jgi:hypothetical protein
VEAVHFLQAFLIMGLGHGYKCRNK